MASIAEQGFIDQYTRKLMVEWARHTVVRGTIIAGAGAEFMTTLGVFRDYALQKKWLVKDGSRVSAKGFATAAAFLRR